MPYSPPSKTSPSQQTASVAENLDAAASAIDQLTQKALLLSNQGQQQQALEVIDSVLQQQPNRASHWLNKGVILKRMQRYSESLKCYQKALAIQPHNDKVLSNLGSLLLVRWQIPQAMQCLHKAIKINSNNAIAHNNLGSCYLKQAEYALALTAYQRSFELDPNNAEIRFNLSWCLLRLGEFQEGFKLYEARFLKQQPAQLANTHSGRWHGQTLQSTDILCICHEQGFGDTFQFIRFVDVLCQAFNLDSQQLRVLVQPDCLAVLKNSFSAYSFVLDQEPAESTHHIALLSLPLILKLDPFNIPQKKAYLFAETNHINHWQSRLDLTSQSLRIGFAYQGSRSNHNDRSRSLALNDFMQAFKGLHLELHSLQVDEQSRAEIDTWIEHKASEFAGLGLFQHHSIQSFSDTAAIIHHLDCVVSVDTSIAHLSAAMGKPTFILISCVHDWRWFRFISHSPWYPSVRLFRQKPKQSWQSVLQKLNQHLKAFTKVTAKS